MGKIERFTGPDDHRIKAAQEAYDKHGTKAAAARSLDIPVSTLKTRLRAGEASDEYHEYSKLSGLDLGEVDGGWTMLDGDGNVIKRSIRHSVKRPEEKTEQVIEAILDGLSSAPKAAKIVTHPIQNGLCAVFPVADLHVGLLTDEEEVGEDWDGKRGLSVFAETFAKLVAVTPKSEQAILAQLGDLTHTDDQRNVTPQSGHQLDADSRFFLILRRAVSAMKTAIDMLRTKYPKVIYRGCRGNHDLTAHYAVTLALAEHYRDVEGVVIVDSAGEFYAHEFGQNMVVLHHGDKAPAQRLVNFAAAEWPEIWGRTKYRMSLSGHIHHETVKEIGGMRCESVGTIIPRDAHAYSHGYTANRSLVSITLDHQHGEINRARVNL